MKILHLTLTRKWFLMILSGEKKEEYREIKPYWVVRLFGGDFGSYPLDKAIAYMKRTYTLSDTIPNNNIAIPKYDVVRFTNGYGKKAPTMDVECKGVNIGSGESKWGGGGNDCFIISLGNIISTNNIPATQ